MSNLRRIFYVSRSGPGMDRSVAKDIALRAQRANRQMDLTGVLAYSGGHFAQVLEGADENLAALTAKIMRDERHTEVTLLFDEPISKRDYAEWSMGFLYDASLSDEIEKALSDSMHPSQDREGQLARRIFLHISDLARP